MDQKGLRIKRAKNGGRIRGYPLFSGIPSLWEKKPAKQHFSVTHTATATNYESSQVQVWEKHTGCWLFWERQFKNTPNQGARYEVLCIELTFLFSSHTREHYGSGPHCFFSHFWSQNFHWNHTNCNRNMTWCHIAHKIMDTIWIVFSHRKNIMGSSPVHRVTIEGMIRSIVPDKSAWLPRTKLQLERLLVGEGRDGSWWRRWGTLTMVSRAGRAFPTVHTDLLLASLMPDNITTSGTRMLDITIKRGRCLTLSQKQELPSSWKNFTNQPLNSLPTENMNLTW